MARSIGDSFFQGDREISSKDVEHLRAVVESCPGLSRKELAYTVCEHWGWVTASGAHKVGTCLKLLERLEARGEVRLPAKRAHRKAEEMSPRRTSRTDAPSEVIGKLADVRPVSLEIASSREERGRWDEYVERYHYLGYKKPFGFPLRYFIDSGRGLLGCVMAAGAAKSIEVRDEWIGWTRQQRMKNLPWVINNTRFLIFPWVQIKHLASHVLGQLVRQIRGDFDECWGYRPVLIETFVDPARYQGTSYRAAGWTLLGMTTGIGRHRPGRQYSTTPKMIYVRPLVRDFRKQLCSDALVGKQDED